MGLIHHVLKEKHPLLVANVYLKGHVITHTCCLKVKLVHIKESKFNYRYIAPVFLYQVQFQVKKVLHSNRNSTY